MTEDEVNIKVKDWLVNQGYHYKGVLNVGKGQISVPDGSRQVLIDHQGIKDNPIDLIWIEAKGEAGMSTLLQGFIRVQYAVYHGGGTGFLAVPHTQYKQMLEQKEFLNSVSEAVNGRGQVGLLNVEKNMTTVF